MIEIVIDGKYIVPMNGSCISVENGVLSDLNNPKNVVVFDAFEGIPELDPDEIVSNEVLPDG